MSSPRVDINCDLGEGAGSDEALMPWVTSANIACGAHAGDDATMRTTVRLALRHRVAIGAHPGYEDRVGFGRRELGISPAEIHASVTAQIKRLLSVAAEAGTGVAHVKPHGALYNRTARDKEAARAVAEAVARLDSSLLLVGLAGGALLSAGKELGLSVVSEVFADRAYRADGTLMPRDQAGSLIEDEAAALGQVMEMVLHGRVYTAEGTEIAMVADSVCVHGDGVHAVAYARGLREALAKAGVLVSAPVRQGRGAG